FVIFSRPLFETTRIAKPQRRRFGCANWKRTSARQRQLAGSGPSIAAPRKRLSERSFERRDYFLQGRLRRACTQQFFSPMPILLLTAGLVAFAVRYIVSQLSDRFVVRLDVS